MNKKEEAKKFLEELSKEMKRGLDCSGTGTNTYVYSSETRRKVLKVLEAIYELESEIREQKKLRQFTRKEFEKNQNKKSYFNMSDDK